jgi:hypothetical protein
MKSIRPSSTLSKRAAAVVAVAVGVLCPAGADAQTVSFTFSGTITFVDDAGTLLPGDIVVGTPFSGTVTYDIANVVDHNPGSSTVGVYWFQGAAQNDFAMTVALGSHTISYDAAPALPNAIEVYYDSYHELNYLARFPLLDGATPPGTIGDWGVSVTLDDNSATVLSSDAIPSSAPSLGNFGSDQFLFRAYNGSDTYSLYGDITTLTPVPEPATASLIAIGVLGGLVVRRRSRFQQETVAKVASGARA